MKSELPKKIVYLDKKNIIDLPDESGVYFLYQERNILVYIGKAASIRKSIFQHDQDKEFSRIGYQLVHYSRARELEKELIELYFKEHAQLPYYNKQT
jgi:excinuclease UvrABC nuclease subunit